MSTPPLSRILATLALLALTGCAGLQPPTSAEALATGRPGYVRGYLAPKDIPNGLAFLPPPPTAGSEAARSDEEAYRRTRALRDTPRWALAVKDADLSFPHAASAFACALGLAVSEETTPHLNAVLSRLRADTALAGRKAKEAHQRRRPYIAHGDTSCTPQEKHKDDSFPSNHAAIGWAWALALAEIAPYRADALFARGMAFGDSRIICGVHWQSDVEAGRLIASATISRLHANPEFRAQMALAAHEIEAAQRAGATPPAGCQTGNGALNPPPAF